MRIYALRSTDENCPGSALKNLMSSLFMHFHLSEIAAPRHQAEASNTLSLSFSVSLQPRSVEKCYNNIAAYYRKVSNVSLSLRLRGKRRPKSDQAAVVVDLGLSAPTISPTLSRVLWAAANAPLSPFASSAQSWRQQQHLSSAPAAD